MNRSRKEPPQKMSQASPPLRLPVLTPAEPAVPPVPERADAARNRIAILEATRRLLATRPMRDICMDDVAREAGVGKGTLYRRFSDRTSLCFALLDDNERILQAAALRQFDLPPTAAPRARLRVLLDALFAFAVENADILHEAEASRRGQGGILSSAVYRWRRTAIARLADACARAAGVTSRVPPELAADVALMAMGGEVLALERERSAGTSLTARYGALFASLFPGLADDGAA